ncbi:MAG: seryl-tRNA synthetase [Verrucomicrobiales bacterium]|nr:seryl-tRNA synthetase [Verrucomicrobiales bacterium]
MLDIKVIREKPDYVRERLASRGAGDEAKVDEVLHFDDQRRKLLAEVEQLKSVRNRVSKEIGALMGQKKAEEAEAKKVETRTIGDQISALDKQVAEV